MLSTVEGTALTLANVAPWLFAGWRCPARRVVPWPAPLRRRTAPRPAPGAGPAAAHRPLTPADCPATVGGYQPAVGPVPLSWVASARVSGRPRAQLREREDIRSSTASTSSTLPKPFGQPGQHTGYELLRNRGPAVTPIVLRPPASRRRFRVIDQVSRPGTGLQRHLDQPDRVGGVLRADHDDQVRSAAICSTATWRFWVAYSCRRWAGRSARERSRSAATVWFVSSTDSVVWDSQATLAGSRTSTPAPPPGRPPDGCWPGLAGGADDLLVALVADQQDVVVLGGEPPGLVVHLGDQGAGRVDRAQVARLASARTAAPPHGQRRRRPPPRAPRRLFYEDAPRASPGRHECVLWTICLRT